MSDASQEIAMPSQPTNRSKRTRRFDSARPLLLGRLARRRRGRSHRGLEPLDGTVAGQGRVGRSGGCGSRRARGACGVFPVARREAARARENPARGRCAAAPARTRTRAHRRRRLRQSDRRDDKRLGHRGRQRGILRRPGLRGQRQHHPDGPRRAELHAARAPGSDRSNQRIQPSIVVRRDAHWRAARHRQHADRQAARAGAALLIAIRGACRTAFSARRVLRASGRARVRRRTDGASAGREGSA